MAGFQPQNIPVKMTAGIDTKSDPKSLQTKLTVLQNASLQSPGQIIKRDGFQQLSSLSDGILIATFKNELVSSDGNSFYSYSPESNVQTNKGGFTPVSLSVAPVSSQLFNIFASDQSYDPVSGLKCHIYLVNLNTSPSYQLYYSIVDTNTGNNLVYNGIPASGTVQTAKVGLVNGAFVISYVQTGGTVGVYFNTISTSTPTVISSQTLVTTYYKTPTIMDYCSANGNAYFAFTNPVGFGIFYVSPALSASSVYSVAQAYSPTGISIASDGSGNIWIAKTTNASVFYNNIIIVNGALNSIILAATAFESSLYLQNVTLNVQGSQAIIYAEVIYANSSGSVGLSNYIKVYKMTIGGSLTAGTTLMKGVGLASKCFNYNSQNFMLVVYAGNYQPVTVAYASSQAYEAISIEPTYFLINSLGNIVLKVAPGLASSYLNISQYTTAAFPGTIPEIVNISLGVYSFNYLFEESSLPVNGVVTSQFGAKSATINLAPSTATSKIQFGNNLHLASGQMWEYDGQNIVEHGFHVYPENLSAAFAQTAYGGIGIGASSSSVNQVQYVATYEWIDNQGQLNRSAPSIPITIPLLVNSSLTPVSTPNVCTFTAQSNVVSFTTFIPGFYIGQVIASSTSPSAFPAGTYITGLYSSGGVSYMILSQPSSSSGSSQQIYTYDVTQSTVIVPTLRQSNKTNVSIVLYRTTNNGTIFYRVSAASFNPNGNTLTLNNPSVDFVSMLDSLPDSQIIGNEQLYTTGNVVENISAPAVSAITTFKNRVIYLSPENPFQWGFSQQVQNGVPVEFNSLLFVENIDQQIGQVLAAGALDDKLILFGPSNKYYVVGEGPSPNGTQDDFSEATKIPGISGCSNQNSVIEIPAGLIYQDSIRGIYLLDHSLAETYIGADVEAYNGITITSAQKFENHNKVIFTLVSGINLVYDWHVNQWEVDLLTSAAVDSTVFQNNFTYIQANGTILQQTPEEFSDNGRVIPLQLQTGWIPFAGLEGFGRVWELQLMGTYFSPHTLTITFYNDFSSTPSQVVTIPVLSAPANGYKFRIKILQQKCTSMMVNITESQSGTPGQGFSLSSLAFEVGTKKGLNKLPAGESF